MIGIDGYWFLCSFQVMFPSPEGNKNSQSFLVVDIIIVLRWARLSRMEGDRMKSSSMNLRQDTSL